MSRVNTQRKMPVMAAPQSYAHADQRARSGGGRSMPRPMAAPVLVRRKSRFGFAAKVMGHILRHPLDSMATTAVIIMAGSIVNNALFGQNASHPAPIFGNAAPQPDAAPAKTDPLAAKLEALAGTTPTDNSAPQIEVVRTIQAQLASRGLYNGTVDGVFGPRTSAAISAYEGAAGMRITGAPSVEVMDSLTGKAKAPASGSTAIANSKMIAVQHVLAEQGFGPLKVDGVFGDTTREAIKRFEVSRNLSPKGEITAEVLKELSAVSGVALD